jgi:hypothetical protein
LEPVAGDVVAVVKVLVGEVLFAEADEPPPQAVSKPAVTNRVVNTKELFFAVKCR